MPIHASVEEVLANEMAKGINELEYYKGFQEKALRIKLDVLSFLIEQKNLGHKVVAYGAAAKGNTLLNYCGVKNDLIEFVVDANPNKQNKFMPASHIPIVNEEQLKLAKPDFVLILPWNLKHEIVKQLSYIQEWGGRFVIPIPKLEII